MPSLIGHPASVDSVPNGCAPVSFPRKRFATRNARCAASSDSTSLRTGPGSLARYAAPCSSGSSSTTASARSISSHRLRASARTAAHALCVSFQAAEQPRLGDGPVPAHGSFGSLEDHGDILGREACKKAHLHHLALARVDGGQLFERSVQCQQIDFFPNGMPSASSSGM